MSHNNQGSYPRQSQSFKGKWGSRVKSSNVTQGMMKPKVKNQSITTRIASQLPSSVRNPIGRSAPVLQRVASALTPRRMVSGARGTQSVR